MVQFIRTIPGELDEAATIDGRGKFRLFYRIILPLIIPAMATRGDLLFLLALGRPDGPTALPEQTIDVHGFHGT